MTDNMAWRERGIMKNWNVELSYGIGFTVSGVKANTKEQAIEKAKHLVEAGTDIITRATVEGSGLEFDQCSFVQEA